MGARTDSLKARGAPRLTWAGSHRAVTRYSAFYLKAQYLVFFPDLLKSS
jgi:hypothetical protein